MYVEKISSIPSSHQDAHARLLSDARSQGRSRRPRPSFSAAGKEFNLTWKCPHSLLFSVGRSEGSFCHRWATFHFLADKNASFGDWKPTFLPPSFARRKVHIKIGNTCLAMEKVFPGVQRSFALFLHPIPLASHPDPGLPHSRI